MNRREHDVGDGEEWSRGYFVVLAVTLFLLETAYDEGRGSR